MKLNKEIISELKHLRTLYHTSESLEVKKHTYIFYHGYIRGLLASGVINITDELILLDNFAYPGKSDVIEELYQ